MLKHFLAFWKAVPSVRQAGGLRIQVCRGLWKIAPFQKGKVWHSSSQHSQGPGFDPHPWKVGQNQLLCAPVSWISYVRPERLERPGQCWHTPWLQHCRGRGRPVSKFEPNLCRWNSRTARILQRYCLLKKKREAGPHGEAMIEGIVPPLCVCLSSLYQETCLVNSISKSGTYRGQL